MTIIIPYELYILVLLIIQVLIFLNIYVIIYLMVRLKIIIFLTVEEGLNLKLNKDDINYFKEVIEKEIYDNSN